MSEKWKSCKILVLDDTQLIRSVIVTTLRQLGVTDIAEAASIEQATPLLKNWIMQSFATTVSSD
jgi:CheY-like chemotaxis protein